MTRLVKVWLCGMFVVAVIVCPSWAADTDDAKTEGYGRSGVYAGIGFVYAPSAFDLDDDLKTENAFGLDARLGYRLCRHVAVEGQYQFVPGYDVDFNDAGTNVTVATIDTNTFTLNGKLYALPDESLQPYFLGGVGFLHAGGGSDLDGVSVDDGTGFAGRVGVGADFYLRPDVVLNLEFTAVLPTGPVSDLRILPLVFGMQYRF